MSTQQERARALDDTAVPGVGAANRAELIARKERRQDRDRRRQEHADQKRTRRQTSSRDLAAAAREERAAERRAQSAVTAARAEQAKDRRWWTAGDQRTLLDRAIAMVVGETRPMWAEQTPHKATTANTAAIFPFYNEGGVGHRGIVIGLNLLGGGAFCFDPWNLYTSTSFSRDPQGERIIKNGNMIVLGSPGEGKSSLVKTMAYRQAAFGRRCEFIDPKGEYGDVVDALGGVVVKLAPGGDQALNPLTDVGDPLARRNLLVSLSRALMGRPLTAVEENGVQAALEQADRDAAPDHEVCLPDVQAALRDPGPELVAQLNGSREFAIDQLRDLMLQLQLLSNGPLAGMFDRPTTIPAQTWDQDAISIDLSAITALAGSDDEGQNKPLAITMMCCSAFLSARAIQRAARCKEASIPKPKTLRVNDEGWRVLAVPGQAAQYQADFKLQRASGVVNVVVMHRLSDLRAAGDDGSRAKKLAEGLRADADTIVIYRQDEGELADLAEQLKLSVSELDVVRNLGQAQALWQVGKWHGVVQHLRSSIEEEISNTDEAMSTTPRRRRTPVATVAEEDPEQMDLLELLDDDIDGDGGEKRLTVTEDDLDDERPRLVVAAEDLEEPGDDRAAADDAEGR